MPPDSGQTAPAEKRETKFDGFRAAFGAGATFAVVVGLFAVIPHVVDAGTPPPVKVYTTAA